MAAFKDELDPISGRKVLVENNLTFAQVTDAVAAPIEAPSARWWAFFLVSVSMLGVLVVSLGWLFWEGVGIWGLNNPVAWGWAIVNFVFWVGIGHAGTLISAILFLFRQKWRTSINRAAEAMTIFAVICACSSRRARRSRLVALLVAAPAPQPDGHVAAISARRCSGTCSPSRPTSRSRCCSGTSA
jgi:hypothetical protein